LLFVSVGLYFIFFTSHVYIYLFILSCVNLGFRLD